MAGPGTTQQDIRQSVLRSALNMVGNAVNDTVDTILSKIDSELAKLFEDRNAELVGGGVISYASNGASVSFTQNLKLHLNSTVAGADPVWIDLGSATRNTIASGNMVYAVIDRTAVNTQPVTITIASPGVVTLTNHGFTAGQPVYFTTTGSLPGGLTPSTTYYVSSVTANTFTVSATLGGVSVNTTGTQSGVQSVNWLGSAIVTDNASELPSVSSTNQEVFLIAKRLDGADGNPVLYMRNGLTILSGQSARVGQIVAQSSANDSTTTGAAATLQPFNTGIVRLTNGSLSSISGIPAGISNQVLVIENQTGVLLSVNNDDSGASIGNRIYTGTGSAVSMPNNATFVLTYDIIANHWMLMGVNGSSSSAGAPVGTVTSSLLTLSQFQGQAGTGWVLAQGQTVSGSSYESVTGNSSLVASNNASSTQTATPLIFSTPAVTTTGNSIASSNVLSSIPLNPSIAAGQIVSAPYVPPDSTVTSIDQYTFALPGTNNGYQFTVHSSTVYIFTVSAANATAGATYTNNGQTFTVTTTISGGTTLTTTGTGTPLASGTLTLATGTGDATITFSSFTYGGANATTGATYTNNGQTFTVTTTLTDGTTLVTTGTGVPLSSGTLTLTSGSGDSTITFTAFTYLGHNATAGATYTNNGQTFTVVTTLVDGVTLVCTGTGAPTSSGTLTLATGSGDSTISFTSVDMSVIISNNATATASGQTIIFSDYVASTTANITSGSPNVTNINNTTGLATGQIITSQYFAYNTTLNSLTVATVPDLRGVFLRGKDNGRGLNPDGDLTLGTYTGDAVENHNHYMANSTGGAPFGNPNGYYNNTVTNVVTGYMASGNISSETKPKNVTVNHFVRIN